MLAGKIHLANALGLKPLDRVQVASKHVLREARLGVLKPAPPPFWFFQYIRPDDGMLCVRSPSGYVDHVDPLDIYDMREGNALVVQAMPKQEFCRWLGRPLHERNGTPADASFYRPAHVMWAQRAKWGNAEAVVRFLDDTLNAGDSWTKYFAPLCQEDRERVRKHATRVNMPIVSRQSAPSWSADTGLKAAEQRAQTTARRFILDRVATATSR